MGLGMEAGIFLAYAAAIMIVYLFGKALVIPLKRIGKLLLNSLIGGMFLVVINVAGGVLGIVMPVNFLTALIAGLLGLPGVACLVIYFNGVV